MNDGQIDDLLKRSAEARPEVDPALVERMSRTIAGSAAPVRPLPPFGALAAAGIAACAVMAMLGAWLLGPAGIRHMNSLQFALIFPVLAALIVLASITAVAESIPGSRRLIGPWTLAAASCVALALAFSVVFPDHQATDFLHLGMKCLIAGLANAIPAALAVWILLRRGFAVRPTTAGFIRGVLAGLAGVFMLELHCANFELPHVIVWHIAVLPLSGLAGWALSRRQSQRPDFLDS